MRDLYTNCACPTAGRAAGAAGEGGGPGGARTAPPATPSRPSTSSTPRSSSRGSSTRPWTRPGTRSSSGSTCAYALNLTLIITFTCISNSNASHLRDTLSCSSDLSCPGHTIQKGPRAPCASGLCPGPPAQQCLHSFCTEVRLEPDEPWLALIGKLNCENSVVFTQQRQFIPMIFDI